MVTRTRLNLTLHLHWLQDLVFYQSLHISIQRSQSYLRHGILSPVGLKVVFRDHFGEGNISTVPRKNGTPACAYHMHFCCSVTEAVTSSLQSTVTYGNIFLNPHNPSLLPSDHLCYPSSQLQLTQLAGQVARSL
jgi:hypothetical protein